MTVCTANYFEKSIMACAAFVLFAAAHNSDAFTIDLTRPGDSTTSEAVLFPFDNHAIPLRKGLQMDLISSKNTRAEYNPVLVRGKPGAPDSFRIGYYGSVIPIGNRFHMWYIGDGDVNKIDQEMSTPYEHIMYAVSDDGLHWEKPSLGLVEYNGNKDNNIVQTNMDTIYRSCTVFYEPQDPNLDRRYKLFFEGGKTGYGNVAFSRDGLTWQPSPHNPVTDFVVEQTGLIKRDGMYYVVGQIGGVNFVHRTLIALMSPDFEHWTDSLVLGFRRDPIPPHAFNYGFSMGAQVHLGAGFWDRGNVLVGLYGQWNGDPTDNDRRYMKMNLGLIITHDGISYTEPIPDFKMIESREENWELNSMGASPRLTQGQGFINYGEYTMTYFGHWGKDGNKELRVARWDLDRLGRYGVTRNPLEGQFPARYKAEDVSKSFKRLPHFISCPITLGPDGGRVFLNCDGLSELSQLRVAVLDQAFNPIAGYSLEDCLPIQSGGFRVPVQWKNGDRITSGDTPIRLRVQWGGVRFEDPAVYAVYVTP